jgi:hypothetical protein
MKTLRSKRKISKSLSEDPSRESRNSSRRKRMEKSASNLFADVARSQPLGHQNSLLKFFPPPIMVDNLDAQSYFVAASASNEANLRVGPTGYRPDCEGIIAQDPPLSSR